MPASHPDPSVCQRPLNTGRESRKGAEGAGDVPYINVKLIEGVFTPDQKQEIVRRLTDTMVEI